MARRNDHSHEEIKEMAIKAGKELLSAEGFGKFSARKVAKEIGYTIGTIYNVFESHDHFILCINATTLDDMQAFIKENQKKIEIKEVKKDSKKKAKKEASAKAEYALESLKNLASSYLLFAHENYFCWTALFEHSLPKDVPLPRWYANKMADLYYIIEEPLLIIFDNNSEKASKIAQIIWAGVHGICQLGLTGKLYTEKLKEIQKLSDNLLENYLKGLISDI